MMKSAKNENEEDKELGDWVDSQLRIKKGMDIGDLNNVPIKKDDIIYYDTGYDKTDNKLKKQLINYFPGISLCLISIAIYQLTFSNGSQLSLRPLFIILIVTKIFIFVMNLKVERDTIVNKELFYMGIVLEIIGLL